MTIYVYFYMCTSVCAQSTSCDPVYCNPPVSSVHGIFQARILKWVAISYSRESLRPRNGIQGFELVSPALADRFLPLSHQGSPYFYICTYINIFSNCIQYKCI